MVGKTDALQMLVTLDAVCFFLFSPAQKQLALLIEEVFQFNGCEVVAEGMLGVTHHVEIHHSQFQLFQLKLLAEQPAVDLDLRPMQQPVVGRNAADIATVGFDLF